MKTRSIKKLLILLKDYFPKAVKHFGDLVDYE